VIKGMPVILCKKEKIGDDPFNNPIYKEVEVVVDDVLVAPSSADDIVTATDLVGKKAVYTLAIPKGDTNVWENQRVKFFGEYWNVFGFTLQGIEENIPLRWNKKVMVERYE
jgi:hypothetical protein